MLFSATLVQLRSFLKRRQFRPRKAAYNLESWHKCNSIMRRLAYGLLRDGTSVAPKVAPGGAVSLDSLRVEHQHSK